MLDLLKTLNIAEKAALMGREVLLNYFGQLRNISEKDQAGLVSEADVESERVISEFLLSELPDIPILGEEGSYQNPNQSTVVRSDAQKHKKGLWLIDPLDGTTNYIHKFPLYCVSIGLEIDGELVVGVCDVPIFKKTYLAARGHGAFVKTNEGLRSLATAGKVSQTTAISVSQRTNLNEALVATGFSSYDKSVDQLNIFSSMVHEVRGVRRSGSAALDLCMVAEGVFDGYWEKNLSPWDTAAGALLVTEAGGVVTTYFDDVYDPFKKTIVAGNPHIHKKIKNVIQKHARP